MAGFEPVTTDQVGAILRAAALRESKPLPCEPTRIIPPRTPGWTVHQDDHTTVQVSWHGQRERYVHERLDRCVEALEAAGLNVIGVADAPRFWLDVFRRADTEGGEPVTSRPTALDGLPSYSRPDCGSVQGAQEHHRAGEPLCALCQRWSDERHRRTRIPAGSRCGTPAGAQMHRQLGEKVCERCAPGRAQRPPALSRAAAKKLAYGHAARTLENSLETREDFFDLYPNADERQRVIDGLREIIDSLFRRADA